MSEAFWLILACGLATYLIRWSGYAVLARFDRLHPRVVSGLNAVPPAVLTAIVAPAAADGGLPELAALIVAAVLALVNSNSLLSFFGGAAVLFGLRALMY